MVDSYVNFANSKIGDKLTSMLGLPRPVRLRRTDCDWKFEEQTVLIGSASDRFIAGTDLLAALDRMSVKRLAIPNDHVSSNQDSWDGTAALHALVYDARALDDSSNSGCLHSFFNQSVQKLRDSGRIIVIANTPMTCARPCHQVAQRALEGLVRSLGKECRRGITAQLVYVDECGASECGTGESLESTLRFLLSGASAYVSGQVIKLASRNFETSRIDWERPLLGQRILVTGASQGIGLAIAEVLASQGAELACLDIPQNQLALEAVTKKLNGSSITLDITDGKAPDTLLKYARDIGGLNALVHNAGITRDKTIARMAPQLWKQVVDVNLSAQERINSALVDQGGFAENARVVTVSSISGIAGNRGQTNYAYSKAGVIGLVQAYASRFDEAGMTINAVAPGFIETEMTAAIPFAVREAGRRLNSMSQGGLPVDVAETIAWFANPASYAVNGNVVRVCGQSLLGA